MAHEGLAAIWDQIDHRLIELKLDFEMQIAVKSRDLDYEAHALEGENPWPVERVRASVRAMVAWAQAVYDTYNEVWSKQGKTPTPQFIRAVCENGIAPNIDRFYEKILSDARRFTRPCRENSRKLRRQIADELETAKLKASETKRQWSTYCEIEAIELEHQLSSMTAAGSSTSPESIAPPAPEANPECQEGKPANHEPSGTGEMRFDPNRSGGKETAIVVSYQKDRQKSMRILARLLTHKAAIKYSRGKWPDPKTWFESDPEGFRNHLYKLRQKAKKEDWWDQVPREYWRSYGR